MAKKHKLDIFTISESWLTDSVSDLEVEFPGFSLFRLDRNYKIGGGVCAYVNNSFKCVKLADLSYVSDTGLHQLWLKVQVKNFKSFVICTAYRTDDVPVNCFETDLSFTLTSAMTFNVPIFIFSTCTNPIIHLFYPPQNLHRHCFRLLLGHVHVPGEIANNEYAKFWGVKEVHYGIVQVVNTKNL